MNELVSVTMPRLGESVDEGTLVKWLVKPGSHVAALDVIAEIDTDKVSAEIPTPVSGVVRELLAREGDAVKVGAEIAVIEQVQTATATPPQPSARPEGPTVESTPRHQGAVMERHQYSPVVRQLAQENALDLSTLVGTGADGRITRADVMRLLKERRSKEVSASASGESAREQDELVPHTRMRRLVAESMTLSKTTIPHAWQSQEVDMSGVVSHRNTNRQLFEREEAFSLTYLPYVVAAAAAALQAHPYANATFRPEGTVLHKAVNIGIPVGLEDGVIVPVIRGADRLSLRHVARAINDLTVRARARKLTPDDLARATFTVNNSGTFGTVVSYSVINPGQAGILTIGAIKDRVVAVQGRIAVRPMMFLSFSLDHRVLDGLGGARFLSACRQWLESVNVTTPLP